MRIEAAQDFKGALKRLLSMFKDQMWLLIGAALAILASVVLKTIAPALIGAAIKNDLELGHNLPDFVNQMVIILVIYLVAWVVDVLAGFIMNVVSMVIVTRIRSKSFAHVQSLSMGTFDKRGIGDIISRMTNDTEMIFNAMMNGVQSLFSGSFSMIGVLVAMFLLSVPLSLVVLAVVPIMAFAIGFIGKRIRGAFKRNQEWVGRLSGSIEESVSGLKVIKAFHREEAEFHKFEVLNASARDAGVEAELISYAFMPIMNGMTSLTLGLIVGVGGWLALGGAAAGVSVGLLTAFILYSQRFFEPLRQVTQVYNILQSAMAGVERIFELWDTKPEVNEKPQSIHLKDMHGHVVFKDVHFSYESGKPVLEGIDFETHPGQVIAIVGPTGAGKTTIINLLSRFYDTVSGTITVDGIDIRDVKVDDLRTSMGVVLQEPFFFATTIRENLLYARHDATDEQMISAAKTANAHYFISRLPGGYDTVLTERGSNLSQGERQLLGIARAILADPRILILDEATSNVDSLTEVHIQEGLIRLMKGRTSFLIAHRLSTIKNADKVLVLHNHRIVESGTHEDLMAIPDGFYARLYSMQAQKPDVCEEDFAVPGCAEKV
jgi:ATP-binding cassette subfamily B protein